MELPKIYQDKKNRKIICDHDNMSCQFLVGDSCSRVSTVFVKFQILDILYCRKGSGKLVQQLAKRTIKTKDKM